MPIFEFRCKSCTHTFETLVIRSGDAVVCPACQSDELAKMISAHAIGSSSSRQGERCIPSACGTGGCPAMGGCG
ncbi:MAG: zinc ribbon domain-containing protein [Zetaproteobacteria bacterium]|nr:zinc ribbon domain-containing protein [Zetaproteobacteria bacterium]